MQTQILSFLIVILSLFSFSPQLRQAQLPSCPNYHRILFIGNSITLSSPSTALEWPGYWGMAASQSDKDWVHQVQLMLAAKQGFVPEIAIVRADIHSWATITGLTTFRNVSVQEFAPDLVIVQMGDNSQPSFSAEQWLDAYADIKAWTPHARHLALGVWDGGNQWKENNVKLAAESAGMQFMQIHDIRILNVTDARHYTKPGVGWHPGDLGHLRIAERVVDALRAVYLPGVGGTIPTPTP